MGSMSNGGLSNWSMIPGPLENGYCTSFGILLNFKKPKVSAVRDFPLGCGLNTLHVNLVSRDTGAGATLIDEENSVANEKSVKVTEYDTVKISEIGNGPLSHLLAKSSVKSELPGLFDLEVEMVAAAESVKAVQATSLAYNGPENSKLLHEVETQAVVKTEGASERDVSEINYMVDGMIPAGDSKVLSLPRLPVNDVTNLKQTSLKNKCHGRKVLGNRDFPPFCGRNAPLATEEERMVVVLGNRTMGSSLVEASVQRWLSSERAKDKEQGCLVRETCGSDIEEFDGGVEDGNALNSALKECVSEPVKFRRPLKVIARAGGADVRDGIAEKRKLAGWELEPKTKFQKLTQMDLKSRPSSVGVSLGGGVDSVIVQGLMPPSSNSWRNMNEGGDVVTTRNGVMATNEARTHDLSRVKGKKLSTSFSRVNVYDGDHLGGKAINKKLLLSKKTSDLRLGNFDMIKNEEVDFSTQRKNVSFPNSSSHGNMRKKVRETLCLFQTICRKLLRGEESKMWQKGQIRRRIDLQAVKIIRARGKEIKTDKHLIGSVPGVEVNDQFQYRVELALVGVHRLYQGGIDSIKHDGMIIATSIVSSGSYADDLDNPNVLMYSGQGGNVVGPVKRPEDQKLERGNLALKNSISVRNPVRVVHGSKESKACTSDARAKIVLTYNYDGLYTVERYWQEVGPHGKLVYMFELKRMPGQPEVAWKEAKRSTTYKVREGLCVVDLSDGKELFPICAVNTQSKEKPPKFDYITLMKYPDWYHLTPPKGCDCIGGCSDSKKCSCVIKNGGEFPYNYNGALVETKTLVYECGPACKCPPSCYNRVTQHGIKIQLEIFKTQMMGWGVRSLTAIPSGSFICEYIGELLEDSEAEQRQNDEYLFDIGQNYSDCSVIGHSSEVVEDSCFTIDAAHRSNVGRFINHSCSPNLYAQNVLYDHADKRMPHIMLFAVENIPPLKELTYHYHYSVDQIQDSNGKIRTKRCYCGAAECTGRMY